MLDEIIINEYNKYEKRENFISKEIDIENQNIENLLNELLDKYNDRELFDKFDVATSTLEEACMRIFFKEGFKKGLQLANEIKQI